MYLAHHCNYFLFIISGMACLITSILRSCRFKLNLNWKKRLKHGCVLSEHLSVIISPPQKNQPPRVEITTNVSLGPVWHVTNQSKLTYEVNRWDLTGICDSIRQINHIQRTAAWCLKNQEKMNVIWRPPQGLCPLWAFHSYRLLISGVFSPLLT